MADGRLRRVREALGILCLVVIAVGCAEDPMPDGSAGSPTSIPDVARVTCEADGSTTLESSDVLAQRDGVHMRVVNRLDEPASLNGLGLDVDPGASSWIAGKPGTLRIACWPFSDHGGPEPATVPLTVQDPEHWYVESELQCTADDDGSELDLELVPTYKGDHEASITPEDARPLIGGLLSDDEVVVPGFADAVHDGVVVVRDGRRIARVGFALIDGRWVQRGGQVCGGPSVTL